MERDGTERNGTERDRVGRGERASENKQKKGKKEGEGEIGRRKPRRRPNRLVADNPGLFCLNCLQSQTNGRFFDGDGGKTSPLALEIRRPL